ncbi:hypothetical protein CMO96_02285 [Candidatus Woesebacteria bacterium]|nr:hypothetical protein [Candidatus Woesebacteria bacterium]|tara:strand:- start:947 stop:1390 length:444 start_codon:yes stop_codon:yes gene_type:complete
MRKEVLIAIIIGVGLGSAVAFGIWRANLVLSPQNGQEQNQQASPSPTDDIITSSQLVVTQPENNVVISKDEVEVQGNASPESTIVILANSGEIILEAEADGNFKETVGLEGGANEITVVAYDKEGNESRQTITVVYSTEFAEEGEEE